jgi:hypothetical protein
VSKDNLDSVGLDSELVEAIRTKMVSPRSSLTQANLYADCELALLQEEFFSLKDPHLSSLQKRSNECVVWNRNGRTGVLQQERVKLSQALADMEQGPRSIFGIGGLPRTISARVLKLLNNLDVIDEGALISIGETFTAYHVEDYSLANFQTLQRVHEKPGDAIKIWIFFEQAKSEEDTISQGVEADDFERGLGCCAAGRRNNLYSSALVSCSSHMLLTSSSNS